MGATIDFILEYDDSPSIPFEGDIDGVIDFTKSIDITHSKPNELMQAIAGIRGKADIQLKIKPRGFPHRMNHLNREYFHRLYDPDYSFAGWLRYSELLECMRHAGISESELSEPIQQMFGIFKGIADRVGDARVRLLFAINT